jgi:hypothetical protein
LSREGRDKRERQEEEKGKREEGRKEGKIKMYQRVTP